MNLNNLKLIPFLILLSACGSSGPGTTNPNNETSITEKEYNALYSEIAQNFSVRSRSELSTKAKIILVAGGSDSANFAQEIVEQRRHWLNLGYSPEEVECFYSLPFPQSYKVDKAQYSVLKDELKNCFPANSEIVLEAIQKSGAGQHDFLYFYSSSHGADPIEAQLKRASAAERTGLNERLQAFPHLNQYFLAYDALSTGMPFSYTSANQGIAEGKFHPDKYFFNPASFKKVLTQGLSEQTQKIVILQACHSGGFLDSDIPARRNDAIVSVPNLVAMAAARYDRSSFGCDVGQERTVYGGHFNDMLTQNYNLAQPTAINWTAFNQILVQKVSQSEKVLVPSLPPSEPTFFTNIVGAPGNPVADNEPTL